MGGPLPPIYCNAVSYGNRLHLKLFEVLYGVNGACLQQGGVYLNKFLLHLLIVAISLLIIWSLIKKLPRKIIYKKEIIIGFQILVFLLLIILLIPIVGITANKLSSVVKYGWYGNKSRSIINLINP